MKRSRFHANNRETEISYFCQLFSFIARAQGDVVQVYLIKNQAWDGSDMGS
jgi:hypothetical protein